MERIGHGAHIVMLLDRSNSMDTTFAGKAPNGSEESKSIAAKRLLSEFVDKRQQDRIGIASYSTSPLFVMPLTENKKPSSRLSRQCQRLHWLIPISAKVWRWPCHFSTSNPVTGARVLLLVSDGAAAIDPTVNWSYVSCSRKAKCGCTGFFCVRKTALAYIPYRKAPGTIRQMLCLNAI